MVTTRERSKPPVVETRKSGRDRKSVVPYNVKDDDNFLRKKKSSSASSMFAKKSKSSSNNNKKKKKDRNGNSKRKTAPKFLHNAETGEQVWIAAATVQDVKTATRNKRPPWPLSRRYLVTVPSPQQRSIVYDTAAAALQNLEQRVLPPYGGRPWQCVVTITDTVGHSSSSPYFCWHKSGRLELAVFPHIVDKMPDTPRFPGYGKKAASRNNNDDDEDESESEEEISEEEAIWFDLQEREVSGLSELAWEERWRVPVPNIHYKWISPLRESFYTRKSAWEHAVALCKNEVALDKVLTGYGANGMPLMKRLTPPSLKTTMSTGKLRFERDGLWVVGQEESWQMERLEQQQTTAQSDGTETTKPLPKKPARRLTGFKYYIQCNRLEHQQRRLKELKDTTGVDNSSSTESPQVEGSSISSGDDASPPKKKVISFTLRQADAELSYLWKQLPDEEKQAWNDRANQLVQQEKAKATTDGDNKVVSSSTTNSNDASANASSNDSPTQAQSSVSFVYDLVGTPPPVTDKKLCGSVVSASPTPTGSASDDVAGEVAASSTPVSNETTITNEVAVTASTPHMASSSGTAVEVTPPANGFPQEIVKVSSPSSMHVDSPAAANAAAVVASASVAIKVTPPSKATTAIASVQSSATPAKSTVANLKKRREDFNRSRKWCLNEEQIRMCYDAGMEHYDQIMRTVTARDLTRELEDGFDLLRERGRGRFDMELPVFDSPQYSFLNDIKNAPWMPIVREILGKEVVLIHKGMFLSMPGSAKQPYHQDGPHLSTQYHKPCHAINVFVPLVDLALENGPTEFCLGSHILGHEELDEDFIEVPTAPAGTPVIFDYRLGHRGLANTSQTCRPIVYCTYAAAKDGKEFRDSVNFSRKRYHKIGDLVEKGLSREERAQKRMRVVEEHQVEQAIVASTAHVPVASSLPSAGITENSDDAVQPRVNLFPEEGTSMSVS